MARTEIRIGGLGGQGIILCGSIIGKAAAIYSGKHVTLIQAFGPEARGSACSAQVTVADEVIGYPYVNAPDILVLLSQDACNQFASKLKPGGLVLYENELVDVAGKLQAGMRASGIPATRIAEELGRRLVLNIVMVGFFTGVTGLLSIDAVEQAVLDSLPKGTEELNLRALAQGYEFGKQHTTGMRASAQPGSIFPRSNKLKDGTEIVLCRVTAKDAPELLEFYRNLPEEERLVLHEDFATPDWAEYFLRKVASGEAVSLVAKANDKIVGEVTLYRMLRGWTRHVGEIRIGLAQSHRHKGLVGLLVAALVGMAPDLGIEKIIAQMVESQVGAQRAFEKLGFYREAVLPGHVKDIRGRKLELLVLANDVSHIWDAMRNMVEDFRPHQGH